MKPITYFNFSVVLCFFGLLTSCKKEAAQPEIPVDETASQLAAKGSLAAGPAVGYVYTMSNEQSQNSILCYGQHNNGTLDYRSTTLSGGLGNGAGLGSQGSIVIDKEHKWLYSVNAGSNSISSFRIHEDGSLTLAHTVSSRGTLPISVTVYDKWLYVVNSTTSGICGFSLSSTGDMTHIPGSDKSLSTAAAGPAQISFTPDGQKLVVTEKMTNMITTYTVNAAGKANTSSSVASAGQTPFGFAFSGDNYIVVSEASSGMLHASTVSSYAVGGSTNLIKGPVANNQTSVCWTAVSSDGRNAYVANTSSNTISSFAIASNGSIRLMRAEEAVTGATPADLTFSGNQFFIYNINGGSHSITEYKRNNREMLIKIGEMTGLPAHANGIAAY